MKKVILFSPNGYVGRYLKVKFQEKADIQLYEMTRYSELDQYNDCYDVMIYSAGITSARHETTDKYVQDNVVAAVKTVDFCRKHSIKRIIYFSSDEIYGELNTNIITENTIMVNPNLYGTTKYLAEKIIQESGCPYYILRLPGIVGGVWGKNFIYNLMLKIKNNEDIQLYNIDREFNNILDIEDLTQFVYTLCIGDNDCQSEILLLGNTEKIKLKEIVEYIKQLYSSSSRISSVDTDKKRYFTLDVTKAVEYGYCSKKILEIVDELYVMQQKV